MSKPLKIRPRDHPLNPPPPTAQPDNSKNASYHGTPSATSSHSGSKSRGPTIVPSSSTEATDGGTAKAVKRGGAFRPVVPGSRGAGGGGTGGGREGAVMQKKRAPLLHEIAAKKYSAFLAEASLQGQTNFPPLSYYRRPRRKRKRPDIIPKAAVTMEVPKPGGAEGGLPFQFAPEWRKPMALEVERIGAFLKPGGGAIEPTNLPPPEIKMVGLLGQDLNQGYLNYVEPETTSGTEEIAELLDETGLEREEDSAHFITYRNNLNKILGTPYSKQKWEMEVIKDGGVIHLEVVMLDRNKGKMDRTSYWGRRFETLCVLGVDGARLDDQHRVPGDPPRPSYCALYRSRLGSHSYLMGAEIDACQPSDPGRFVEIKTTRHFRDAKDEQIFKKHKALKYWSQCYLAGVKDLVVGHRDDQGIVRDVRTLTTDGLVDNVDKIAHWDKDVCLNFADRCLSFLKDNVDEGVRYRFNYLEPYDHVTLEPISPSSAPSSGAGASVSEATASSAMGLGGL